MRSYVLQKVDNDASKKKHLSPPYGMLYKMGSWRYKRTGCFFYKSQARLSSQEKMSSSWGPSRTTQLAVRRQELPQCLPSSSNHPHPCSVAPCQLCRDPHLSSNLLSRPYSLPCAYWQLVTAAFADCISSLWEAETHDRSCTRTTSLGGRSDGDLWEQNIQTKDY